MRKFVNECCGCASPGYPCEGGLCPRRSVEHFHCDKCGAEDELYEYDGKELCLECLLENFPVVEGSEIF
jgi:hypothetical protein